MMPAPVPLPHPRETGTSVTKIRLTAFRNYESTVFSCAPGAPVVLTGPNGAGKTNLLEALSLLTPGKGLRGADIREIQNINDLKTPWAIAAQVTHPAASVDLGTGRDSEKDRRIVRINGNNAKSQAELSAHIAMVWLTPQMDGLFLGPASARRRFLDRLVFAFDPAHAGRVTRYENALRQRSKILRETEKPDPVWLTSLEAAMAETGVSIAAARRAFIENLQNAAAANHGGFPGAKIDVVGWVEEGLQTQPALVLEERMKELLKNQRADDAQTGGARTGPHRSDFNIRHAGKNMAAALCSTGEQKALLITVMLAHADLIRAERGTAPILLLDEVAAHLDEKRRQELFERLIATGSQFWLTGTEEKIFFPLQNNAELFNVSNNYVIKARARDC